MSAVHITVRGSHSVLMPPEQATVHATLSGDGPAPGPVFDAVAGALAAVRESLESRHHQDSGPVTRYVVDQVRMGSHRPYNQDGAQLPPVHTASVSVTATFIDFGELAAWVSTTAGLPGLGIDYIDWALTENTRLAVERETRQHAVRDSRRRAQDYADALDLGTVVVHSISDPGLGTPVQRKVVLASAMAAPAGGPPELTLRPEDVEIHAEVEATFTVHIGG